MKTWAKLCEVDPQPAIDWLRSRNADQKPWHDGGNSIARQWAPPDYLIKPILDAVFACFAEKVKPIELCMNRVDGGFYYPMHIDRQNAPYWVTRVHVPLVTNPQCWHRWEVNMEKVHFPLGSAYSFNTEERHEFANEGTTPRIHLLFDVHRIL